MGDRQDVFGADRGFITGFPDRKVLHADGKVSFDLSKFDHINDDTPAHDTVYLADPRPLASRCRPCRAIPIRQLGLGRAAHGHVVQL
jgi:hypothetical protein